MKLTAALEYEKMRSDEEGLNRIVLHKDGTFYHVYEWSAWLVKTIVCTEEIQKERGDAKVLQVYRYKTKNNEYLMLGFPVNVLGKFIPDYVSCEPIVDSNDLIVEIELPSELSYETMQSEFEAFKASCEEKQTKKSIDKSSVQHDTHSASLARSGLFGIAVQVLSYPLEQSTSVQNIDFISGLKKQVSALL